jgi:tripartite-type tricarboxylate transporter receptor subunit TctC
MRHLAMLFLASACASAAAQAQEFPTHPIRFILGPSSELLPRLVGQHLTAAWKQQVIVDPRPGGGGAIAADLAAKAAPDGYTWLLSTASYTINAAMLAKPPYNLVRDFAPVTLLATAPFYLLSHPSLPVSSLSELLALARAKPGQLNYSSAGTGSPGHLAGELFRVMGKVDVVHVPYKSSAAALSETLGGQIQFAFMYAPVALPQFKSGKMRALAVSSLTRAAAAPDIPTLSEAGLKGFEVVGWTGVHVPMRTPPALIARIHDDIARVLKLVDVRERLAAAALEPAAMSTQTFDQFVQADLRRWATLVEDAGITPQ